MTGHRSKPKRRPYTRSKLWKLMERERERFVLRKLEEKGWNISAAAVALGIKRSWLYHLIGKYEKLNRAWKAARRKRYADLLGEP